MTLHHLGREEEAEAEEEEEEEEEDGPVSVMKYRHCRGTAGAPAVSYSCCWGGAL